MLGEEASGQKSVLRLVSFIVIGIASKISPDSLQGQVCHQQVVKDVVGHEKQYLVSLTCTYSVFPWQSVDHMT